MVPLFGHPHCFARRHELVRYRDNVLVALEVSAAPRYLGRYAFGYRRGRPRAALVRGA